MAKLNIKELNKELSMDELSELDAAAALPPVFDNDSPEMTAEMLLQFKRVRQGRRFPCGFHQPLSKKLKCMEKDILPFSVVF